MILLVSGSTQSVSRIVANRDRLGILTTPKNRNSLASIIATGLPWAVDNGAFSGFNSTAFMRLILKAEGLPGLLWVACPDVVGSHTETLIQFYRWAAALHRLKFPVAFVGQDGCENGSIPWDDFQCFFMGGSTEWKLSDAAGDVAREAKRRGKWLHMGRVNSLRRIRRARLLNCDSIDGSSASMFGDAYIAKYLRWIAHEQNQTVAHMERN